MNSFRLGVPGRSIGIFVVIAVATAISLGGGRAEALLTATKITSDVLDHGNSLYGIDANSANTDGPFHAPLGIRLANNTGASVKPTVTFTLTMNATLNGSPCGSFNTTSGLGTTAVINNITILDNSSQDYFVDLQFVRDSGCADKNNNPQNFSWQAVVSNPASTPSTITSGTIPITGLSAQNNDTAGFTSCKDANGNTLATDSAGVINLTAGQPIQCTFTWSTSTNYDGVRVWQDWNGKYFEITKVNSNYPTGTFATDSPDCVGGSCGSGGKSTLLPQVVNVQALAATVGAPGTPCPSPDTGFCVTITSTTYDQSASGTHYVSQTSPPIFKITSPTAVRLKNFDAVHEGSDNFLSWRTGHEVNNLGFRIYRDDPEAGRVVVTPDLVAGNALFVAHNLELTSGRSYHFTDRSAPAGATYWLEDVDISGATTLNGPVYPKESLTAIFEPTGAGFETQSSGGGSPFLSDIVSHPGKGKSGPAGFSAQKQAGSSATNSANLNRQFSLAAAAGMKILVQQEGWYRFSRQDLANAGWDPGSSPTYLQLYVEGQPIPMLVNNLGGGNYSMEFYGTGLDTVSTDTRVYWLRLNSTAGSRLASKSASSGSSPGADFPFTIERKDRTGYVPGILNGDSESWYGPLIGPSWFPPADQSVTVTHLDTLNSGSATLEVSVQGATADVAHAIDVKVNGSLAGTASFVGQTHFDTSFSIPVGWLVEGHNTIQLSEEGSDVVFALGDYVALTYPHLYRADSDLLEFTVSGGKHVSIPGFTVPGIRVFDITNPSAVATLSSSVAPDGGGFAASLNTPSIVGTLRLLAVADDRVSSPAGLSNNTPSNLNKKSNSADLAMISHPSFLSATGPMTALRQSQGLATQVIDLTDVYDEFSFGEKDPAAIKAFLQNAKATWKKAPKYVLLIGDGSLDPRDYLALGSSDFVPAKLVPTVFLKTASDDWFVDFNNDGLADMAIGRLPAQSLVDATTIISKIVGYESSSPSSGVLIVGDHNDENNFHGAISGLASLVGNGKTVHTICVDPDAVDPSYPNIGPCVDRATAHTGILNGFNGGSALVNWVGHGEDASWSQQDVFDTSDVPSLTNSSHLPLVLTMDCLNGYFQDPTGESMAESLLRAPNGGAVAVWASSSLTLFESQVPVNQTLFRQLFSGVPVRLGDAVNTAKAATTDSDVHKTWILFGDPTMFLR